MILALVLACAPAPVAETDPEPTETSSPEAPSIADAVATPAPLQPSVLTVTFTTPADAPSWVEYGEDAAFDRSTPSDAGGTDHHLVVLGLAYGATVTWRAVAEIDGVRVESPPQTVTIADPDPGLPVMTATTLDAARSQLATTGLLLVAHGPNSWFLAIDGRGRPTWTMQPGDGRVAALISPARDGDGYLAMDEDLGFQQTDARIRRIAWTGEVLTETPLETAHHMFVELPDGRIAWSGLEFGTGDVDGQTEDVLTDTLGIASEGVATGPEDAFFRFFEDWVPYYVPCIHSATPQDIWGRADLYEWTHTNSIALADGGATWLVNVRLPDALLKIDPSTGEILWQAGGRDGTFTFDDPSDAWSHSHFTHAWDDRLLVMDNGAHHVPPASRVVEYRIDEDDRRIEKIWEYAEPSGALVGWLGDARRLSGGNTLIAWTPQGRIDEVTPDGEVVWTLTMEGPDAFPGRMLPIDDPYRMADALTR